MGEPPKGPRRRPKQARSRQIVEAIYGACERILTREGPDALNTNRIAEVAGVNIASVYRYFPDKEAIVAELYETELGETAKMLDGLYERASEIDSLSLRETLAFLVDQACAMHGRLLALHAEFYRAHHRHFDLAKRTYERHQRPWVDQLARWLEEMIERRRAGLRDVDPENAAFLLSRALTGILERTVEDAPEKLESESFRRELHHLLWTYLQPSPEDESLTPRRS